MEAAVGWGSWGDFKNLDSSFVDGKGQAMRSLVGEFSRYFLCSYQRVLRGNNDDELEKSN